MLYPGYHNNLIYSRKGEEKLSKMMTLSISFHLLLISAIVIISIISNKKSHILDASYVTLVTISREDASIKSEPRPAISSGIGRKMVTKFDKGRSVMTQKDISDRNIKANRKEGVGDWWKKNKESLIIPNETGDKVQKKLTVPPPSSLPKAQEKASLQEEPRAAKGEEMTDWWKKNKESLVASDDAKTQKKLTVPQPATIPKVQEKPASQKQGRPQVQEKTEGLNDWWKKNKESLIIPNETGDKVQKKLTVPPPSSLPKAQEKASLQEEPRAAKGEEMTDWWKKNKETIEEENRKDKPPVSSSHTEDKVALNNPNLGNVGIKVDNLGLGFPPIYFESITNKIQRYWFPPSDLTVILAFNIKPSGEITDLHVEKGSGNNFFDRSAIRAVIDSTPLPPFPEGFKEKDLRVHFTFIGEAIK